MSLISQLRPANPSEFARKRKVDRNPPPKGKRKSRRHGTVGPKSVSHSQRVHEHLGKYLTVSNKQVARELVTALSTQYSISSTSLLAAMRDRATLNDVAVRTLKVLYPAIIDIACFSHTLDLVGSKFVVPHLNDFMTAWISLFSHSPKAHLIWKEQTGRVILSYSPTHWWSRWELMSLLLELYGDIAPSYDKFTGCSRTSIWW